MYFTDDITSCVYCNIPMFSIKYVKYVNMALKYTLLILYLGNSQSLPECSDSNPNGQLTPDSWCRHPGRRRENHTTRDSLQQYRFTPSSFTLQHTPFPTAPLHLQTQREEPHCPWVGLSSPRKTSLVYWKRFYSVMSRLVA